MLHTLSFHAMGTNMELGIWAEPQPPDSLVHDLNDVQAEIQRLEQRLSRFEPASDISRLNQNAGVWVSVHAETLEVLHLAARAFVESEGLFHPALGAQMEQLGYDRSFDVGLDRAESVARRTTAPVPPRLPWTCSAAGQVRLEAGCKIDLGGIAKGWIVEQAAHMLRNRGQQNFVVNAGGDMVCARRKGDAPWSIGIADPAQPDVYVLTLDVENACVATSGTYRRRWRTGRDVRHHILDPRTGLPADSDLVSCTVIHPSLVAAEVMAKVFLILGLEQGRAWMEKVPNRGWAAIRSDGEVTHSWTS